MTRRSEQESRGEAVGTSAHTLTHTHINKKHHITVKHPRYQSKNKVKGKQMNKQTCTQTKNTN